MNFRWFPCDFFFCYFGLPTNIFSRKEENLKDVFNRALIRFHFLDSYLKLPLLFNESISCHLYVKDFSVLFPFATLSCGL